MNEFEEIISSDDSVSNLLNNRTVTAFSNFSRKRYSDDFKEYIETRYYASFQEILKRLEENPNPSQAIALVRSVRYLATETLQEKMISDLIPFLETALQKLTVFKDSLAQNDDNVTITAPLDQPVDAIAIKIFNEFKKDARVNEYRDKIIIVALEICDSVGHLNPKKNPFKYHVYNAVMNNLKTVDEFGPNEVRYQDHVKKIGSKRANIEIKYAALVVVVIILILLKFLS